MDVIIAGCRDHKEDSFDIWDSNTDFIEKQHFLEGESCPRDRDKAVRWNPNYARSGYRLRRIRQ